jgi:2-polyprenyl-6-hydroxyphenyl methylase/3-demethylubiquinone-9 3-methyltransferase
MFADLDASRSAQDSAEPVFPPSGRLVRYHRCVRCGFVFTPDFDRLTDKELSAEIYNADYVLADPEFADHRPRYFAGLLGTTFAPSRASLSCLDFGGGRGVLAGLMCENGFAFDSFDPYFDPASPKTGAYDLVTAFEVVEHSRTPAETFRAALAHLNPHGLLLFSTLLQPRPLTPSWRYIAPRNGHVSIHTRDSLRRLARNCGVQYLSIDGGLHAFYRGRSPALDHLLHRYASAAAYAASLDGLPSLAQTVAGLAIVGHWPAAASFRLWSRAILSTMVPPKN